MNRHINFKKEFNQNLLICQAHSQQYDYFNFFLQKVLFIVGKMKSCLVIVLSFIISDNFL